MTITPSMEQHVCAQLRKALTPCLNTEPRRREDVFEMLYEAPNKWRAKVELRVWEHNTGPMSYDIEVSFQPPGMQDKDPWFRMTGSEPISLPMDMPLIEINLWSKVTTMIAQGIPQHGEFSSRHLVGTPKEHTFYFVGKGEISKIPPPDTWSFNKESAFQCRDVLGDPYSVYECVVRPVESGQRKEGT